jgi:hypothetical protein
MTTPVPSMNAMVDSITDAVECAIARGLDHPGGVRRFMFQGAVRHALRDIHDHHTPLRRFNGVRPGGGRPSSPRPVPRSSRLQFAPGICSTHGHAMFVRRVRVSSELSPMPSSLPRPSMTLLPPPPNPPPPLTMPWNGGGGLMAERRGASSLPYRSAGMEMWSTGFGYDLDVALPSPALPPIGPPLNRGCSYADVAVARPTQRLPPRNAIGAGFASSSNEGEAVSPAEPLRGSRCGRLRRSRHGTMAFVAGARWGRAGHAPLAGLHGRRKGLCPDPP